MKAVLKRCAALFDKLLETAIWVAFTLMSGVGVIQVFFRYVLKNSLSWSEEFQKYMHIWLIFLAIPLAYKNGSHIGMNVLFDRMPPRMQKWFLVLVDVLWLGMGIALVRYTLRIMTVAERQTSPGLGLRMDAVYACIVICGIALCVMAVRKLVEHLKSIRSSGGQTQ